MTNLHLCLIGDSSDHIWGRTLPERTRVQFARAGLDAVMGEDALADAAGEVVLVRADALLDVPLASYLIEDAPVLILSDTGAPLAVRVPAALVPQDKITKYLLSSSHPAGRGKAAFFAAVGFTVGNWQELAAALIRHAADNDVVTAEPSRFGTRYAVEGALHTPDGSNPTVRAVWFVEEGRASARLVTAYPCEKRT